MEKSASICLDIETSGLDAQECWITCVGILEDGKGIRQFTRPAESFRSIPQVAEGELLREFICFWNSICMPPKSPGISLLTYNGRKFDIPFLLARLAFHNIPEPLFPQGRRHIDLSEFVKESQSRYVSKDVAASHMAGIYVPSTVHGGFLARIYGHRRVTDVQHLDMLQHNAVDLATTRKMHSILREYPDFNTWLEKEERVE